MHAKRFGRLLTWTVAGTYLLVALGLPFLITWRLGVAALGRHVRGT